MDGLGGAYQKGLPAGVRRKMDEAVNPHEARRAIAILAGIAAGLESAGFSTLDIEEYIISEIVESAF